MAKAASESIMAPDKMKPLLALSTSKPVQAAIGLTVDGEGIILLDKRAKPRKVMSMLRGDAGKAGLKLNAATLRFGRAEVDTDYDATMVRFFINKEAPGNMRIKLVEVVKKIAYQKVEFNVDPALEEDTEEEDVASGGEASATAPVTAAPSEAARPAPAGGPAPRVAPPPPPAPPALDGAVLMGQLRDLIGRIPAAAGDDASRKAALSALAGAAGAGLKSGDLAAAAEAIGKLRAALAAPAASPGTAPASDGARIADAAAGGTAGAVAYGKARLIWISTRKKVIGDIDKVMEGLRAGYADEDLGDDLAVQFKSQVEPILTSLDESLADALDDAINQTDAAKRAAKVAEARAIVGRYQSYLAGEPLIAWLDENPFVPVSIAATLSNTLQALSAAIR